jgi:hypothetical protein
VVPLLPAQDFKRVGDGDTGPNTGGMGAYAPLPWAGPGLAAELVDAVVAPVAAELVARGTPFQGLLYAGLALTSDGPAVIEFNCRFGDPETQVVLALLRSPLARLLHATATGALAAEPAPEWADGAAVTVVLAAEGYPGRRGSATPSPEPTATASCTPARAGATTARSCRRAGACSRWWARAPTSPPRGTTPTAVSAVCTSPAPTTAPTSPSVRCAGRSGCPRPGDRARDVLDPSALGLLRRPSRPRRVGR